MLMRDIGTIEVTLDGVKEWWRGRKAARLAPSGVSSQQPASKAANDNPAAEKPQWRPRHWKAS